MTHQPHSPTSLLAAIEEVHCNGSEAATDHIRAAAALAESRDWHGCGMALRRAEDHGCHVNDLVLAVMALEHGEVAP